MEIVVFDLEFTAWEGSLKRDWAGENEHKEIVEIGAVRINLDAESDPERAFSALVHPVHNPQLSEYFISLTKITQQRLDQEATSLASAMDRFQAFATGAQRFYAYGEDADIIAENCALLGIQNPLSNRSMIDARAAIQNAYGLTRSVSSADLPDATGIAYENAGLHAHQALDDARAVAHVLVPLLKNPNFSL